MEESSTRLHKKAKGPMEESESISRVTDICEQILNRYGKFIAPQDRLCKTAEAIRTRIEAESLPLTPLSYFLAVIDEFKRSSNDVDVLSPILAIVLPQVSEKERVTSMAVEALQILVQVVPQLSNSSETTVTVIGCLGHLLQDLCNIHGWASLRSGFETLLEYSLKRHPKVRKCAQDCFAKLFKNFQSLDNKRSASEWVSSFIAGCSRLEDDDDMCLHMRELIKVLLPCFPSGFIYEEFFTNLHNHWSNSSMAMRLLDVSEEILGFFESESKCKSPLDRLLIADEWNADYHHVLGKIAGFLNSNEDSTAAKAFEIFKGVFERVEVNEDRLFPMKKEKKLEPVEYQPFCYLCNGLLDGLRTRPKNHTLAVITMIFGRLGAFSILYMRGIIKKLADHTRDTYDLDTLEAKRIRDCMGSAIVAMKERRLCEVIPIEFDSNTRTCSNMWLISMFKDYDVFTNLGFFIKTIVPLANTVEEARQNEKESVNKEQLRSLALDLWGLLPALCRWPTDLKKNFGHLATLLIPFIKKDAFMLESIAIGLQYLVKQNKDQTFLTADESSKLPDMSFCKRFAKKDIKVMSSRSEELLRAFSTVFFQVAPHKRGVIKETIKCLSLITESSTVKEILFSHCKKMMSVANISLVLELAQLSVGAARFDFTDFVYSRIKECLQEEDEKSIGEAYDTFYKILNEYPEFMSSKFDQLVDLLLGLKSPDDIDSLRCQFLCFKNLIVFSIKITSDGENTYGSHMLNEILQDSKEERRKVAHDIILEIGSILQETSSSSSRTGPYYEFISMIMCHLSLSCGPLIRGGAVSALSLLITDDSKICHLMPELVPTVLDLLDTENSIRVITVVLDFVKVLVTSLQVRDLQNFLSYILGGILPWSSVSQRHIKSEVTFVLEIMMRKCGSASVNSLVPEKYRDFVNNVLENHPSTTVTN